MFRYQNVYFLVSLFTYWTILVSCRYINDAGRNANVTTQIHPVWFIDEKRCVLVTENVDCNIGIL